MLRLSSSSRTLQLLLSSQTNHLFERSLLIDPASTQPPPQKFSLPFPTPFYPNLSPPRPPPLPPPPSPSPVLLNPKRAPVNSLPTLSSARNPLSKRAASAASTSETTSTPSSSTSSAKLPPTPRPGPSPANPTEHSSLLPLRPLSTRWLPRPFTRRKATRTRRLTRQTR
jgi:hypothetical protein